MPNDTKQMLPKNRSAPDVLKEQFGAISIRCKLLATLEKLSLGGGGAIVPQGRALSPQATGLAQTLDGFARDESGSAAGCSERHGVESFSR